ncbi:Glycosyl transferase family 2 [Polymorphum gilvum SL003B-26A1]|uniref:Glycosyl transferase family 2 n=1 Tax=Polymorphum gilvum (strain LMG 25793 / CGMCC 1.9160 / SL003B-26A1) TaxID=991905 RepID=F2J3F7_POLGS|nr:Glycosyl transferase family 2 [Polymorphum gilvum SL003B-26A1]
MRKKISFWLGAARLLVPALRKHGVREVVRFLWSNLTSNKLEAGIGRYMAEQSGLSRPPNVGAPQGHLPKSASPQSAPAGFVLDLAGLGAHIARWHKATSKRGGKGDAVPEALPDLTFVVSAEADEQTAARLAATLGAIGRLDDLNRRRVRVAVLAPAAAVDAALADVPSALDGAVEGLEDFDALAARLDDDDRVLHLFAGDTLYGTALTVLDDADAWSAKLVGFDGYWLGPDNLYRLALQLAADLVHLYNCDCLYSRFAVRGSTLKAAISRCTDEGDAALPMPYRILRRIARSLIETGRERDFVHLPVTLVEIHDLPDRLARERRAVALGGRPFGFPFATGTARGASDKLGSVSVVIATKSRGNLLRALVDGLIRNPVVGKVVIIANGVENLATISTLNWAAAQEQVEVVRYDQPFNFSRMNNIGASLCDTPYVLFLNDDIVLLRDDWLDELLKPFDDATTAAAGMLLLYPNESVQHAGMFLGFHNCAGHLLRHATLPEGDYGFLGIAPRQVSTVTGAALMVDHAKFRSVNGFDEQLAHYIQDVDLCLRFGANSWRVVYQPGARAVHMESITILEQKFSDRVLEQRGNEHQRFMKRWGDTIYRDPWFSPAISYQDESLRTLRT